MRDLHHLAGTFLLSAVFGAIGIVALCWVIIHAVPLLTSALDAITGA